MTRPDRSVLIRLFARAPSSPPAAAWTNPSPRRWPLAQRLPRLRGLPCWPKCDCSGRCCDPDVSAGHFGEDVEGPAAVLGRGGQLGAHRGEVLGAGEGAHAPGHLLLNLDHPDVAFGLIVVERNARVGGEAQVVLQAPADAAGPGAGPGGGPARGGGPRGGGRPRRGGGSAGGGGGR